MSFEFESVSESAAPAALAGGGFAFDGPTQMSAPTDSSGAWVCIDRVGNPGDARLPRVSKHCVELEAKVDSQAWLIEEQHNMFMLKSYSQAIMCDCMGSVQARIRNLEGDKLLDRQYLLELDKRMEKELETIARAVSYTHLTLPTILLV